MKRRSLFLTALSVLLAACAQAPTQRLAPTTEPLRAVRVFAWGGADPALAAPALEVFSETLRRNGLSVTQTSVLPRPVSDLAALERLWGDGKGGTASHALVLTRQHEQQDQGVRYVRYEAVLWDAGSRKLVWKATLGNVASRNPMSLAYGHAVEAGERADRLAGDLLRGLDRDALFPLGGKAPRDAKGEEIPATLLPLEIR